jgi:hypothetical protein
LPSRAKSPKANSDSVAGWGAEFRGHQIPGTPYLILGGGAPGSTIFAPFNYNGLSCLVVEKQDQLDRLTARQPLEEADSACERVFSATGGVAANSTNRLDSPSFLVLAPAKNPALSAAKHFFNGLL